MTPDEKEQLVLALKDSGRTCMMCGDGANDVGALKQAQVRLICCLVWHVRRVLSLLSWCTDVVVSNKCCLSTRVRTFVVTLFFCDAPV